MIKLFVPGFFDIFYGLSVGIVAGFLLLTFAQWVRGNGRHGVFSLAAAVLVGLFVAAQAALWFKAGDVLEYVEETPSLVESYAQTLGDAVDGAVPQDSKGESVDRGMDAVKSGIFGLLRQTGNHVSESIRSFRNHRLAWGGMTLLLGCCIVPLLMENGHRSVRRNETRRRVPRGGRRRVR